MIVEELESVVQNFDLRLFNALMIYASGKVISTEKMDDFFILKQNAEERNEEHPRKLVFIY